MTIPYQKALSNGASPFMRWVLSPVLLIFAGLSVFQMQETVEEGRLAGTIICVGLILACLAGVLALWGVPGMGRIVSGIIALAFGAYVVHECFLDFDGEWGWGKSRSQTTPINSILGFLVFGLPCLIYTVLGRFTVRQEAEYDPMEDGACDEWSDDDEIEEGERLTRK